MHHGSCLCGSIQYSIDDELKFIVNCHCRFCRKAHGAPFTTVLFMPFSKFELTQGQGSLTGYEVTAANAWRYFCAKCGTRLYSHSPSAGMISLVVASLETGAQLHPIANINVESRCPWYEINDGLPQFQSVPSHAQFGQLLS